MFPAFFFLPGFPESDLVLRITTKERTGVENPNEAVRTPKQLR